MRVGTARACANKRLRTNVVCAAACVIVATGCTMDEVLAETSASEIACEASRELTLASDITSELYSIVALPDGWALFYRDDRQFQVAELDPGITIRRGPFPLDSDNFDGLAVLVSGDHYELVYPRRQDGTLHVLRSIVARAAPASPLSGSPVSSEERSTEPVIAVAPEGPPWIAYRVVRDLVVGRLQGGRAEATQVYSPERSASPKRLVAASDGALLLTEADGAYAIERFDAMGRHVETHALPAISAADLGNGDGELRVAYATEDGVEVWHLADSGRPDAMLARYEASGPVATLRSSEGAVAWIDGEGDVQVAFPEQAPRALGTGDAIGTLRLETLAGGALVAVEGSDPQRVSLYRVCR